MRILYVCADRGIALGGTKGAAAHVRCVVNAFRHLNHEVMVLAADAMRHGLDVPVFEIAQLTVSRAVGDHVRPRLGRALGHIWNNASVESALRGALADFKPHLIYERYAPFGAAAALMAARLGVRHVLEVNAPLAWEGRQYRQQALSEAAEGLEQAALAATSCVVAVSDELREMLIDQGVDANKIVVVPNGVDIRFFTPDGPVARIDGVGPDRMIVGFVGSLKAWHGVEILVEAFRVLACDPAFHLLVVGDGPEARRIDQLGDELQGRVTRIPVVRHDLVPSFLRAIDVAVAPYPSLDRFYYSPLKVLEYLATGRAIVASRIGQVQQLVRDGETGLLVPPGDVATLVRQIRCLAADGALRRRLGAAAAQEARRGHGWEQRVSGLLSLARVAA